MKHSQGVWDSVLPSRLLVEAIDTASARIVYAWANHPQELFKGGWVRVQAKVLPGDTFNGAQTPVVGRW